jgi:hypothetical protein
MDNAKRTANHAIKISGKNDGINVFSGIIRCVDCGAVMTFNRKASKSCMEHRFFRCNQGKNKR